MTEDHLWYEEEEFQETFVTVIGSGPYTVPNIPKIVEEAARRGAEQSAIDHAREGKIKALQYMKCHLFTNYCCMPDACRNTKIPNKKCGCSKNRMLSKIIEDINYEMHIVLNQRYLRHL